MAYIAGDFWRICERSGFKVRASHTSKQWDGLIVRDSEFETRHEQDFVRGRKDRQNVPDPRPEGPNTFYGALYTVTTAAASPGALSITVESTVRWQAGDTIGIPLSDGNMHRALLHDVPSVTVLTLTAGLPVLVESGAVIVNQSAVSEPDIG